MAAQLGERGGKARTRAKVAAARANGRLGGRPRKTAA
jgi:DNA invertase Pin-like site-specific DNA recombinase